MSAFRELQALQGVRLKKAAVDGDLLDACSELKRRWPALADRLPLELVRASHRVKELYFSATPLTRDVYALDKVKSEREEAEKEQERQLQQQQGRVGQGQGATGARGSADMQPAAIAAPGHDAGREPEDDNAWGTPWDPQPRSGGAAGGVTRGPAPGDRDRDRDREVAAPVLRRGSDSGDLQSALHLVKDQHQLLALRRLMCSDALERLLAALDDMKAQLGGRSAGREEQEEVKVLVAELRRIDSQLALMGTAGQAAGQAAGQGVAGGTRFDLERRRALVGQLLRTRHGEAAQHAELEAAMAQQMAAAQEDLNHTRNEIVKDLDNIADIGRTLHKCAGFDEGVLQDKIRRLAIGQLTGVGAGRSASHTLLSPYTDKPYGTGMLYSLTSVQLERSARRRHIALAMAASRLVERVEPEELMSSAPRMRAVKLLLGAAAEEVHGRLGVWRGDGGGGGSWGSASAGQEAGRDDRYLKCVEQVQAEFANEEEAAAEAAYLKWLRPGVELLKLIHAMQHLLVVQLAGELPAAASVGSGAGAGGTATAGGVGSGGGAANAVSASSACWRFAAQSTPGPACGNGQGASSRQAAAGHMEDAEDVFDIAATAAVAMGAFSLLNDVPLSLPGLGPSVGVQRQEHERQQQRVRRANEVLCGMCEQLVVLPLRKRVLQEQAREQERAELEALGAGTAAGRAQRVRDFGRQVPAARMNQSAKAPVAFLAVAASATAAAAGCRRAALLPPAAGAAAATAGPTANGHHNHDDGDKDGLGGAAKADAADAAGCAGGQQQLGQQQVLPQGPPGGQQGVEARLRPSDLSQALLREDNRLLDLLVGCYDVSYYWGAMPLFHMAVVAGAAAQGSSSGGGGGRKGGAGERAAGEDEGGRVTNAEELTQKQLEVWHELHSTPLLHHLQARLPVLAVGGALQCLALWYHTLTHPEGVWVPRAMAPPSELQGAQVAKGQVATSSHTAPLSVHAPPAPGLPSCVLLLPLGDLDPSSRVGRSEGAKRRPALAVTQGTSFDCVCRQLQERLAKDHRALLDCQGVRNLPLALIAVSKVRQELAAAATPRTLVCHVRPLEKGMPHWAYGVRQRSIVLMVLEATAVDLSARRVVLHPACRAQLDEL